jgi:hypothetical protein
MPIVSRRSLGLILEGFASKLSPQKYSEIVARLEHNNTKDALAAEAELLVTWAISNIADVQIEPSFENTSKRIDLASKDLLPSGPVALEITALSDDNFSGNADMVRTANIISNHSNEIRSNSGKHLTFNFNETRNPLQPFSRARAVDPKFELTENSKVILKDWITSREWPNCPALRLIQGATDVEIHCHSGEVIAPPKVFSTMPAVAYDLKDNPIYKAIEKKSKLQLAKLPKHMARCLVLVDVGSFILRNLWSGFGGGMEVTGKSIITAALKRFDIDVIIAISSQRENPFGYNVKSKLVWRILVFDRRASLATDEHDKLYLIANNLPPPVLDSFQARNLHKIGALKPQAEGNYLPTKIFIHPGGIEMTIKISSRLVLEYFSQRIDGDRFKKEAFGEMPNLFEEFLRRGSTIQEATFENSGPAADDDYLNFKLSPDWAALGFAAKRG